MEIRSALGELLRSHKDMSRTFLTVRGTPRSSSRSLIYPVRSTT